MLGGWIYLLWQSYGPKPPVMVTESIKATVLSLKPPPSETPTRIAVLTATPSGGQPASPTPTPMIEERNPLAWRDIDLSQGEMTMIYIEPAGMVDAIVTDLMAPWAYFDGIFETEYFDPDTANSVVWADQHGRITFWGHSGPDQPMTPLQEYLERDEHGNTVARSITEDRLANQMIDARVLLIQNGQAAQGKIIAAIRVPPDGVQSLMSHVGDLPEYLRDAYPGHGFQFASGVYEDLLMIFFCGRRLAGEDPNPSLPIWQQSRFVLAVVPD